MMRRIVSQIYSNSYVLSKKQPHVIQPHVIEDMTQFFPRYDPVLSRVKFQGV